MIQKDNNTYRESIFGRKEKCQIAPLYNVVQDEILKARIKNCLGWYIEHAEKYKLLYKILGTVGLILPLVITVINSFRPVYWNTNCRTNVITILSALTSLVAGLQAFFSFQEKWILYRSTAEEIKRELTLYHAGTLNADDLYKFVVKVEQVMAQERIEWIRLGRNTQESAGSEEKK